MKKVTCYSETINVDGEKWTVMLIPEGTGKNKLLNVYLFDDCGHAKSNWGFILDQTQAKIDPHVYTPEEVMELALFNIEDDFGDLKRITKFEEILSDYLCETDDIREKNKEIYGNN